MKLDQWSKFGQCEIRQIDIWANFVLCEIRQIKHMANFVLSPKLACTGLISDLVYKLNFKLLILTKHQNTVWESKIELFIQVLMMKDQ